jgi:SAM-dependent methyltransferase
MADVDQRRWWWDAMSTPEGRAPADEIVNRALRWREIERHLGGVRTVLDVGGGTGAFSIPLARRGFEVTHVDFSPEMLADAQANAEDVSGIEFVEANAVDLSSLPSGAYDLVLNLDGAISFCGTRAVDALRESARLTGRTLIVTVSHRAWMSALWISRSIDATGEVLPAALEMFEHGLWQRGDEPGDELGDAVFGEAGAGGEPGPLRSFLPEEHAGLIRATGMYVERVGGLGSMSLLCTAEAVARVREDQPLLERFIDLCDRFDRDVMPHGPGTRQRAGLIAVAHRARP